MNSSRLVFVVAFMSPRGKGRIAGVFYTMNIVTGAAAAIFISRGMPSYGQVANFAATVCYIAVTTLFYEIFKPVNRVISLIAAFSSLAGCAVALLRMAQLDPLGINPLAFFGFYCVLIGYLIFRSTFLPAILGGLMALGGLSWLTFLFPALATRLLPYNAAPGVLVETTLTVWLLRKGLNKSDGNVLQAKEPVSSGGQTEERLPNDFD